MAGAGRSVGVLSRSRSQAEGAGDDARGQQLIVRRLPACANKHTDMYV
jgi:hypothetical protein